MPPKSKRLETKDFSRLSLNASKSITHKMGAFDLKVLFNNKSKFACVVKKNIFNKAVLRNKARRVVYSVLTSVFKNEPYSIIAYPRKEVITTPYAELLRETNKLKEEIDNNL